MHTPTLSRKHYGLRSGEETSLPQRSVKKPELNRFICPNMKLSVAHFIPHLGLCCLYSGTSSAAPGAVRALSWALSACSLSLSGDRTYLQCCFKFSDLVFCTASMHVVLLLFTLYRMLYFDSIRPVQPEGSLNRRCLVVSPGSEHLHSLRLTLVFLFSEELSLST